MANPSPAVRRLADALAARGHGMADRADRTPMAWMLGADDVPATADRIAREGRARGDRIAVLSWIGAHPDARAEVLRRLWTLEERCRASGLPVLTLRLGALAGPESPLWRKLAEVQPGARLARKLIQPVLESDVVEALDRALRGQAAWDGWQELGGPDILSVGELCVLARAAHPAPGGAWEPDAEALAEQRLIEPEVWARWSGFSPGSVVAEAGRWAA